MSTIHFEAKRQIFRLSAATLLLPDPDAVDFGSLNIRRKEQHGEYGARD